MSNHVIVILGAFAAALLMVPLVAAEPVDPDEQFGGTLPGPHEVIDDARHLAQTTAQEVGDFVEDTTRNSPDDGEEGGAEDGAAAGPSAPGLSEGILSALTSPGGIAALAALGLAGMVGAGFLLATRYVDPKECLENPQRSMLYGCIKGQPGVNLKQLSEDFDMKTSTVLWHIRKLEGAELVRSQKANGLRVFYPVNGGVEAKRLGAAVAALTNENASTILDYITIHPGTTQKGLVNALGINAGTVRWHLRKLKDMGLMAELSQGRSSNYYPTELGLKALTQTMGLAQAAKPVSPLVAQATVP